MRTAKRLGYDDAVLIYELALGQRPKTDIARELGVCHSLVSLIATGKRRPHLQPLIQQARRRILRHLRKRIRRRAATAFRRHLQIIRSGSPAMARQSREYILRRTAQPLTQGKSEP